MSACLYGRGAEVALLCGLVDEVVAGRGRSAIVTGEPGIGKTRLVDVLADHARRRSARVAVVRCPPSEGVPAFWPWTETLAAISDGQVRAHTATSLSTGTADELVSGNGAPAGGVVDRFDVAASRFELFSGVRSVLRAAATTTPVVVVLDDLHWADALSLQMLEFLVGQLRDMAVLVAGTYRDVDDDVVGLAARLPGDTHRVELRPLDRDGVSRLVAETTGTTPSPALAAWVHDHTGGNPLFVQETVRLLMSEGRLREVPSGLVLPAGVRGVIRRRLEPLATDVVEDLRWAALCGDEFEVSIVEQASGRPRDAVETALAVATRNRLVRPLGGRTGRHRFSHGLVAETLRDGLDPVDRAERHLRVGRLLVERRGPRSASAAEISHHFVAALPHGDPVIAAHHARRAAEDAVRALAWEAAAHHYDVAHRALAMVDEASVDCSELLVEKATAAGRSGDPEARKVALAAVEAARATGPPELFARAVLVYAARAFAHAGDTTTLVLLDEALRHLPADDTALRVLTLARFADEAHTTDRQRSDQLTDEALAVADRIDEPLATWEALFQRHRLDRGSPDLDARRATSERLVQLGMGQNDDERTLLGRIRLVVDLMATGDRPAVDQELVAFARTADRARLRTFQWWVPLWKGGRALAEGRLDDAESHATAALEMADPRGEYATTQALVLLGGIRFQQCRLEEVEPVVAAVAGEQPTVPVYRCTLALVHAELGRTESAQALLDPLAADGFATIPRDQDWAVAAYCIGEVCRTCRRADWGRAIHDLLVPYGDHHLVSASGGLYLGPAARLLGGLAALCGDAPGASRWFRMATAASRRVGASLWTAQVAFDEAAALAEMAGTDDGVPARLDDARAFAAELGVPRLLRQAGAPPVTGQPARSASAPATPPDVFRQEGAVWTLAFRGRTARLPDRKGLHDIALLLRSPGRQVAVAHLLAAQGEPRMPWGADCMVDAEAQRQLLRRLDDLRAEADEADQSADPERAAQARLEIDQIVDHLGSVLGRGQRARRLDDVDERDRKRIWRRIRTSIDAIDTQLPALAHHLRRSIRTGAYCSYTPEHPVDWTLQ